MLQTLELTPASFPSWDETPTHYPLVQDHFQEWLASAVNPDLIRLNVESLSDTDTNPNSDHPYPIAERLNWPIIRFGHKARSGLRGWWVSGLDPFNQWQRMSWGRFKPDSNTPVMDMKKGEPAKYLSPSGDGSSRVTFLDLPLHLWQKVADRYGLPILDREREMGFWPWAYQHNLPIILTEGEKKAGCLLSFGYAAIALPGIFNGYRKEPLRLIPELEYFATPERKVFICFDYETKPKTLQNIQIAIAKTGKLLTQAGCMVQVISLPGSEKGVDDFIVAQGADAFETAYQKAQSLDFWQAAQLWSLTYPANLVLNQRYLGTLSFPAAGLVAIKSPKGTGKTAALEPFINQASAVGRKVIVLTHRIQLGRAICQRLGLDWVEDRQSETLGLFGLGLCVDSMHYGSQARFNPQHWKGAILVLDEAEQVLWHLLNSQTCFENRVKILETFRELIQVVLSSGGLIIAQDADLSNLSIDYLKGLAEVPVEPWVVVNEWQTQGCEVTFYDTANPAPLLYQLQQTLETNPVFLTVDSQKVKGKWSSKNLESYFQAKFPDKKILRIDSETVADPQHAAYGMVERINADITQYDLVIATPTIGTGVSIDVKGHFGAVFGIFQGATPDAEARQAMARVREDVPRWVWAKPFGPGKIGNGSCNYRAVIASTTKAVKYNIALLKTIEFDIDAATDPISLRTWAKMSARVNASMWRFRDEFRQGLEREGHQMTVVSEHFQAFFPEVLQQHLQELSQWFEPEALLKACLEDLRTGVLQFPGFEYLPWRHPVAEYEQALAQLTLVRDGNKLIEAHAVVDAPDISTSEYEQLRDKRAKTTEERYQERKHELEKRYAVPVSPELKIRDDEGWYSQLRLHYYLTHNPEYVRLRDIREWQGHLERGEGKIALQDIRLLTLGVEVLKNFNLLRLVDPDRKVRATDADVQRIVGFCQQFPQDIKTALNLTISEAMTPMQVIQVLLHKVGVKLTCVGRDRAPDGRRGGLRVYQYCPELDGRDAIFAAWAVRDAEALEKSLFDQTTLPGVDDPGGSDPPSDIFDK